MKILSSLLFLSALLFGSATIAAPSETELKIAYIDRFIAFTTGFESEVSGLRVGLLVSPELFEAFSILEGKSTNHGKIELQKLDDQTDFSNCCDVLFLGAESNISSLPASFKQPTLVISDYIISNVEGVLIQFVRLGSRLKFQVNIDKARQAGLRFDSHLINVAI